MTADAADAGKSAPKRRGRPPIVRDFYGSALTAAEAITLKYAEDIEGLDKEIALLRTKLREALGQTKENDTKLMIRGMELLAKLVSVRYRLSAKAQQDIASNIAGLIQGVGEQFYPEGRHGS